MSNRPQENVMSVIVIQFITLDGIVSDPDGSEGTQAGGWAFRHGPETVARDKFRLGSVTDTVKSEPRDVIIMGSLSVVHALMGADLVDEYRLLTFPTILGTGERLFPAGGRPAQLECLSAEQCGPVVLSRYARA